MRTKDKLSTELEDITERILVAHIESEFLEDFGGKVERILLDENLINDEDRKDG